MNRGYGKIKVEKAKGVSDEMVRRRAKLHKIAPVLRQTTDDAEDLLLKPNNTCHLLRCSATRSKELLGQQRMAQ